LAIPHTRINHQITAPELRIIGAEGENVGVVGLQTALQMAQDAGLDLIEISPKALPPVAKIMDYGKFQYDENKKQKTSKARVQITEIKTLQVKIGTGEHDLELKAKKAAEWLKEGHKVKIDLFLPGRAKYLDPNFLKERLGRILKLIPTEIKSDEPKKSPKGMTVIIENA
jgi:translation initiation factor IF-3